MSIACDPMQKMLCDFEVKTLFWALVTNGAIDKKVLARRYLKFFTTEVNEEQGV